MIPLRVTAEMLSAPELGAPVALDAILLWCLGAEAGAAREDGWADPADVYAGAEQAMPLARVEGPGGWWWACSDVAPSGRESKTHLHRRPPISLYEEWCPDVRSVGIGAGPDKALRVPHFLRPAMRTLTWTAIGDAARVRALLAHSPGVGRRTAHGCGMVTAWRVEAADGPALAGYASDPQLRHLPVEAVAPGAYPARWRRYRLPLRAPYHDRGASVPVIREAW